MSNAEIKIQEGEALVQAKRPDLAEKLFHEALELAPGHTRALNNLAVLSLMEKRWREAEKYLGEALKYKPGAPGLLSNLLTLRQMEGQWAAAETAALDLLAAEPGSLKAIMGLIAAQLKTGAAPGEANVERLLAAAPQNPQALALAAAAYEQNNRLDKAARLLEAALKLAPKDEETAVRLALLKNPENKLLVKHIDPLGQSILDNARLLHQIWGRIESEAPAFKAAKKLGNLFDPGRLTDTDMSLSPSLPPLPMPRPAVPHNDLKGLSVLFGPTSIAGANPVMKTWLEKQGCQAAVVEVIRTYFGYKADYFYPTDPGQLLPFIDEVMSIAKKSDFLCLDFCSSFRYMPNFISRSYYGENKNPEQPYADLLPLKDSGTKILFQFFGSDCTSQSDLPWLYLKYLGFDDLPAPPMQTKFHYRNIKAAAEVADAFVAIPCFKAILPKVSAPYWDMPIEPDLWPMKETYNSKVKKILTAPSNPRKKNYTLTMASLYPLLARYPEVTTFRVQGTPHDQVAAKYAQADLGIDQVARGFGTFSVEMMALGLPVITNRFEGAEYRETAPTLTFRNIRDFYSRLEECVRNPDMLPELGRLGREYAMTYHDIAQIGANYSQILSDTLAGRPGQVYSETYARDSQIWERDPETVYRFKFYDMAVPLFCALGEPEYGVYLCLDAMDCDYRPEKFHAWHQAICSVAGFNQDPPIYQATPETDSYQKLLKDYKKMLRNVRDLLDEYAAMMKEAEKLKETDTDWAQVWGV